MKKKNTAWYSIVVVEEFNKLKYSCKNRLQNLNSEKSNSTKLNNEVNL